MPPSNPGSGTTGVSRVRYVALADDTPKVSLRQRLVSATAKIAQAFMRNQNNFRTPIPLARQASFDESSSHSVESAGSQQSAGSMQSVSSKRSGESHESRVKKYHKQIDASAKRTKVKQQPVLASKTKFEKLPLCGKEKADMAERAAINKAGAYPITVAMVEALNQNDDGWDSPGFAQGANFPPEPLLSALSSESKVAPPHTKKQILANFRQMVIDEFSRTTNSKNNHNEKALQRLMDILKVGKVGTGDVSYLEPITPESALVTYTKFCEDYKVSLFARRIDEV